MLGDRWPWLGSTQILAVPEARRKVPDWQRDWPSLRWSSTIPACAGQLERLRRGPRRCLEHRAILGWSSVADSNRGQIVAGTSGQPRALSVRVDLPRRPAPGVRDSITEAFRSEGVPVDSWGVYVPGGAGFDALQVIWVAILLSPVGGIAWDIEKPAIRKVLSATKRLMSEHRVGAVAEIARPNREPVVYGVPKGPEGDLALEAIDADYAANPTAGHRVWWPGEGWISDEEYNLRDPEY
jgi:hypothetical protein